MIIIRVITLTLIVYAMAAVGLFAYDSAPSTGTVGCILGAGAYIIGLIGESK